jgi:hypothetical protein
MTPARTLYLVLPKPELMGRLYPHRSTWSYRLPNGTAVRCLDRVVFERACRAAMATLRSPIASKGVAPRLIGVHRLLTWIASFRPAPHENATI